MAKPIVTQSLVSDAANALKKEGIEPSIIAIQKHIGAGSFTTIKKFLDVWKEECDATLQNAPDTPAELEQKGRELTRAVWVLATQIAQQAVTQIKEETAQQLSFAEKEAIEAHEEISRLENIEVQLNNDLQIASTQLHDAEIQLTEAQTQAKRIPGLEADLSAVSREKAELTEALVKSRAQLDQLTEQLSTVQQNAQEASRTSKETNDALRAQLSILKESLDANQAQLELVQVKNQQLTQNNLLATEKLHQNEISITTLTTEVKRYVESEAILKAEKIAADEAKAMVAKLTGQIELLTQQNASLMAALQQKN